MIFPFEGRLWVFFFFPSCANLFLKERRTGVVPTDLSPSSSSSCRSGDDDVNDDDRGSRVDPCTLKEVCRPTTKKSLKKRRRDGCGAPFFFDCPQNGGAFTIQKRSSNVFRVLDFYFLIFCTCVLCAGEFYFLGNPKVDDDDDD